MLRHDHSRSTEDELDTDAIQRDKLAMLGQLTAGVAHELNNPIGYVASNLNTLQRYLTHIQELVDELAGVAGAEAAAVQERHRWPLIAADLPQLLADTIGGAEHLKNLVADLKTLGRTSATREFDDPSACVLSALNVLTHRLKHGYTVERRFDPVPPVPLIRPQLIQAVTNILHNAIHAMPEGGRLSTTVQERQGRVVIAIEDDGPGVPTADAQRIFTPYFTTKPASEGTGLGLSIVRRIMHKMDGGVHLVPTQELGGARFELDLPVAETM
ncbi:MAG: sensor histidine kinase [Planctomycetota bacterium]